jgi:hypothetical protein
MNKSKLSFYFIFTAFFTFIAIFITIVQSSYNNLINPIKQATDDKLLQPMNPTLDSEIIQEIENRPEYINSGNTNIITNKVSSESASQE